MNQSLNTFSFVPDQLDGRAKKIRTNKKRQQCQCETASSCTIRPSVFRRSAGGVVTDNQLRNILDNDVSIKREVNVRSGAGKNSVHILCSNYHFLFTEPTNHVLPPIRLFLITNNLYLM